MRIEPGDLIRVKHLATPESEHWYRILCQERTPCLVVKISPIENPWTGEDEDDLIHILYKNEIKIMRASGATVVNNEGY